MIDETSPEMRRLLVPYEESMARFDTRMAAIGEEFGQRLAAYDTQAAERDKQDTERLAEVLRERAEKAKAEAEEKAKQAAEQHIKVSWPKHRKRQTTLNLGAEDDEFEDGERQQRPHKPRGVTRKPDYEDDFSDRSWMR